MLTLLVKRARVGFSDNGAYRRGGFGYDGSERLEICGDGCRQTLPARILRSCHTLHLRNHLLRPEFTRSLKFVLFYLFF